MRNSIFFLTLLLLLQCTSTPLENPTDTFLPGKPLAELQNKKLSEISGIAASLTNPGLLWVHNDSGNGTEVFLIDSSLHIKYTCMLHGIENRDWEDIAVGPGPDNTKSYLYIGDIGDNFGQHELKYIYRFEEPTFDHTKDQDIIKVFDTFTFKLPDEQKDSETLLIDPSTKDLYIISKREEPVIVYKLDYPYSSHDTLTATKVLSLPLTEIVGGDISHTGNEIILKNYEHIYYWNNVSDKPIVELLHEKPQEIPYKIESQGEAIAWAQDGSGFYTISEKKIGQDSFLYFYKRK